MTSNRPIQHHPTQLGNNLLITLLIIHKLRSNIVRQPHQRKDLVPRIRRIKAPRRQQQDRNPAQFLLPHKPQNLQAPRTLQFQPARILHLGFRQRNRSNLRARIGVRQGQDARRRLEEREVIQHRVATPHGRLPRAHEFLHDPDAAEPRPHEEHGQRVEVAIRDCGADFRVVRGRVLVSEERDFAAVGAVDGGPGLVDDFEEFDGGGVGGVGWAEPDNHAGGFGVDFLHHADLGGAFGDVGLVDAEGVDP